MLNPFFIQGTTGEQGLVQDLINEQLKMYGIEVYYMPREIVTEGKVIKEVLYSKFTKAFPIEAYLANYEGFDPNSILMSKFGVRISDEMILIISKERFETYIGELMKSIQLVKNPLRPNEGDLIYIPLSDSFMEIKYVENRKPFFQLQKNYVYELRCELFELEDEEINTSLIDIDSSLKDKGYESTLTVSGIGLTATATTTLVSGAIQKIDIISSGYRYTSVPSITVPSPISGTKGRMVGILTSKTALLSSKSLHKIYIENPGSGYNPNKPPAVTITGGNGYGAEARVSISTYGSIGPIILTNPGQGYVTEPTVTISPPQQQLYYNFSNTQLKFDSTNIKINDTTIGIGSGVTAVAKAVLNGSGGISTIRIINAGYGYTEPPTVTISSGSTVSTGNFIFNETVTGSISSARGTVKSWDSETKKLKVVGFGTEFIIGDTIVGSASSAIYVVSKTTDFQSAQGYDQSDDIQEESDDILEFTEVNPFGEV